MSNVPSVYVGTYAKYNDGNLHGAWLDLEDYADKDEFYEACKALHSDEEDPELMFQDHQLIPSGLIGESHIDDKAFEFAQLDEHDREMYAIYLDNVNDSGTFEEARESFRGKFDSKRDFAQDWHDGGLEGVPDFWQNHIDWDSVVREMEHEGFTFVRDDGDLYVFVD